MKLFSEQEDYYLRYGLDRDPFPVNTIDNIFYTTPELNQRIDLIKHLLEFGRQLVVVTAPPGAGKTMLSQYLLSVFDPGWSVNFIRAIDDMTPEGMAFAVISELYPADYADSMPAVDRLYKYLEHCDRDQKLPVIMIDEGERLSLDALEFILQLNEKAHNNTRFRFVIFGGEKLNRLLDDPRIKVSTTGILHNISIPLLTGAQTVNYLEHRLKSSGDINPYPFTDRDAQHIHKVSGGAPGRINRLARQAMQGPSLPGTRMVTGLRNPIVIACLVFVILVVSLLIYDRLVPDQAGQVAGTPPAQPAGTLEKSEPAPIQRHTATEETTPSPASNTGSEAPVTPGPGTGAAMAEQSAPQSETAAVITKLEKPAAAEAVEDSAAEKPAQAEPAAAESPEPAAAAEVKQAPPAKPAEDRPESFSRQFAGLRGADWVRAQDPDKYVLQVIGAQEVKTLEQYLAALPELRNRLAVIATRKDGQPWYVLLYGLYPDHDTARRDINNLPADARRSRPWARPVAAVQQDLDMNQ